MNKVRSNWPMLKQAGGGLLWALFLIFAPFEVLFFGALIWIPFFIWRERVRATRYGYWPGAALRYSTSKMHEQHLRFDRQPCFYGPNRAFCACANNRPKWSVIGAMPKVAFSRNRDAQRPTIIGLCV
jgi:hypothetical protein